MLRQKRIALINDITGFGRCSVAVQQPIISAMKIQACALPTAILSTHTCFPGFYLTDFTSHMKLYMDNWQENQIEFDGICTGFLSSEEQISLVLDFFRKFKKKNTLVVVDPVMGDNGKLYSSYTLERCQKILTLLPYADLITPNLTEACYLLGIDYSTVDNSLESLENIAKKLSLLGPKSIVITGILKDEKILNFVYGTESRIVETEKIGEPRTGTGDVFTAIVAASLVNGESLYDAVVKAVEFIRKAVQYTSSLGLPFNYGLCFEEYLNELV